MTAISATNTRASTTAAARPRSVPARLYQMAAETGEQHAAAITVFGPPKQIEQRNQQQATAGRAQQVEEVDPIHAFDGFGDGEETTVPREEERQARWRNRHRPASRLPEFARCA